MRTSRVRVGATIMAVAAVFALGGCGSSGEPSAAPPSPTASSSAPRPVDPDRPTVPEIIKGLQYSLASSQQLAGQMQCIGQAFYDSKLSNEVLKALVEGDADFKPSSADQQALLTLLSSAVKDCGPSQTP